MPTHAATPPEVRVYVFDTGVIASSDYSEWSPTAPPGTRREMSVRSYLIVHPDGALLWDTGIADAISANPAGTRITDAVVFRVPTTLRGQLEGIGHDPAHVGLIGLSHMHIDHVGNLDQLPDARILVQQNEHMAAYGPDPERLTYIPEAYATVDRESFDTVSGEHDVFGDQTVVMVPLPGHTPGHQGLLVALRNTGLVLLAGDIAYSTEDYVNGVVRQGNVDLDASRRSIEVAQRLERNRGATVWLHHDLDAQRAVQTAPSFYG